MSEPVTALAQRCEGHERPAGVAGGGQLGPAESEAGDAVGFECAHVELVEVASDLVDPHCVLAGEEAAACGEQRALRRRPGPFPVLLSDRRFGAVDRRVGHLQVDVGVVEGEAHGPSTVEVAVVEDPPQS